MNDPIMTDMRSEYSKSLIQLGKDNPNVVVLGADTTDSLKTSGFGKEFPNRFFNVGIAEANLVTISAGLAVSDLSGGTRQTRDGFVCSGRWCLGSGKLGGRRD